MNVPIGNSVNLASAVESLQEFLNTETKGEDSASVVRQKATAAQFPYPELAAQVFKFLQQQRVTHTKSLSVEDIEDAFLSLLLDADAVEALGKGKVHNPWAAIRAALRNTGQAFGKGLIEVYEVVRRTGLGYVPTIFELAKDLGGLLAAFKASDMDGPEGLQRFAEQRGIAAWQIAVLMAWWRKKKKGVEGLSEGDLLTDADLEDLFSDPELLEELDNEIPDGPWDIYKGQGEALRMLRHFGRNLVSLHDAAADAGMG